MNVRGLLKIIQLVVGISKQSNSVQKASMGKKEEGEGAYSSQAAV